MNEPDISKADFSALLELAESRFHAWHLKELTPELNRRTSDLKMQNLTSGGRAAHAMRIYRELLERDVRERIGFYAALARDSGNPEMLSKRRLEEYRDRIMTTVRHALAGLKEHIERDARAAGFPESALPTEQRYIQLRAEILDVVNAELRVIEAEGKLVGRAGGVKPEAAPDEPQSQKPAAADATSNGTDRRKVVDAYIEEVRQKTGNTITRTDIWKKAGDKTRAEFERWESLWYEKHGKKPNKAADRRFTRVLREKPHLHR
jgi:hypothetical protein